MEFQSDVCGNIGEDVTVLLGELKSFAGREKANNKNYDQAVVGLWYMIKRLEDILDRIQLEDQKIYDKEMERRQFETAELKLQQLQAERKEYTE